MTLFFLTILFRLTAHISFHLFFFCGRVPSGRAMRSSPRPVGLWATCCYPLRG